MGGKKTIEQDRTQTTIWSMRVACLMTTATNTLSENVLFIDFPQQQSLQERVSLLRCTYNDCLVEV